MSVVYVLLPVALVLAGVALYAFVVSVRRGQYDDLDTPAVRMLHDDEPEEGSRR
jgi:cbb3-type cytochrome oxidase maturation protein